MFVSFTQWGSDRKIAIDAEAIVSVQEAGYAFDEDNRPITGNRGSWIRIVDNVQYRVNENIDAIVSQIENAYQRVLLGPGGTIGGY